MNRKSKVIALCLLLSIVVSAFAVFSFAADATMSPVLVYDMEASVKKATGDYINGDPVDINGVDSVQLLYKEDANGRPYYQHRAIGELQADGTYKNPNVAGDIYFQHGYKSRPVIVDSATYGEKNADFFVIDFDLSTDGTFGDYFYFQNRWYNESGKNSQNHYPRIDGGTVSEKLNVLSYKASDSSITSGRNYLNEPDNTGWVDITLVYDFRGQVRSAWNAYVYLNGTYAGEIGTVNSDAVTFALTRFVYDTTFLAPEATVNLANYTLKYFPVNYDGELSTKVENLGAAGSRIDDFADLSYCLEDKPETVFATVERKGEEELKVVSNPLALDGSLMDGDKVTLYGDLVNSVVVPHDAKIEWVKNDHFMVDPTPVDYSEVNVVLRDLDTGMVLGYANEPIVGVVNVYDQNKVSTPPRFSNNSTSLTYTKNLDQYDRVYWTLSAPDATNLDSKGPWHAVGWGGTYIPMSNINYLVFDLDVDPGDNSFETIEYNLRFSDLNESTDKYTSKTKGSMRFNLVVKDGKAGVSSGDGSKEYYSSATEGNWTHITVVYDLTSENHTDWKSYAYIDGEYMGVLSHDFNSAEYMYFVRFQPLPASAADATISYANHSLKRMSGAYNGKIGSRIGKSEYKLSDIPELAYCLENDLDAAPVEDNTPVIGITTKFDQATANLPSWSNRKTSGIKYTASKDSYGRTYWTVSCTDATKIIGGGGAEWHQLPNVTSITLADINYLVFDVDLKPGTNAIEKFFYNMRFNTTTKENFKYVIGNGEVGVQDDNGTTYMAKYSGEWAHLTFIYDFSSSSYADWTAHLYVDGVYVSEVKMEFAKGTTTLKDIRFQTPEAAAAADATTSFANWTAKTFDNTYNGTLGKRLGNTKYTLADIKEMAYCLENVIGTEPPAEEPEEEEEEVFEIITTDLYAGIKRFGEAYNLHAVFLKNTGFFNSASLNLSKRLVVDLNGKTMTTNATAGNDGTSHCFITTKAIVFCDGKIVNDNATNANVVYIPQTDTYKNTGIYFNDVDVELKATHPFVEQRNGYVSFSGCNISASGAGLVASRGGNVKTALRIENCDVEAATSAIEITNTLAEGKRHGSLNSVVEIVGSTIKAGEHILSVKSCANEVGKLSGGVFTPTAGYGDNNNVVDLSIVSSDLVASGAVVYSEVSDVRNDCYDVNADGTVDENDAIYADNFKLVTNTDIVGGSITADYLVEQFVTENGILPATYNLRSTPTVLHTTNLNVDAVDLELGEAFATKNIPDSLDTVIITLDGECALNTNKETDSSAIRGVTVKCRDGHYLVPRSAPGVKSYAVTKNVTPYPYIIDGEEYEFFWYAGDPVSPDRIPVDIPKNHPYVNLGWADELDENGAYYLETVVTVPIKANMTLSNNFAFNLYLPTDLGADAYDTIKVNDEKVAVMDVTIDGVAYKLVSIRDISPINAAEAFDLSFTITLADGTSATANKRISILDYAESVLKNQNESKESRELIAALVNYIAKVYAAAGAQDSELAALLELDEYKAITLTNNLPTAKSTIGELGVFEAVGVTAGDDFQFSFRTTAGFNGNLVFTYYKNGSKFMETIMVRGGEVITLDMKAYDLLSDITIRYNGVSGEYNLSAYIESLVETESDTDIIELANALAMYSAYAKAYVAA